MNKIGIVVGLMILLHGSTSMAQTSTNDATLAAIDAAIASLKEQPNQFQLSVTAIGAMGMANGGGTGLSVTAQGGGPGSQTTGLVASADGGQITIARQNADAILTAQAAKAVELLTDIKRELHAQHPDKATVASRLAEFSQTYVAPVAKAIVEALIKKRLGL